MLLAATGRGIGELLGRNSRAYALVGGAGILGGITRMTLSVTVMMVEASGWVLFVIPLMLVFIVARAVGNRFNEGIYDTQISIKKMPFLEQVSRARGTALRREVRHDGRVGGCNANLAGMAPSLETWKLCPRRQAASALFTVTAV